MTIGAWKNIDELEEELSLVELSSIILAKRDNEHRLYKVILATVGVDMDEGGDEALTGDKIRERVTSGTGIPNDIVGLQGDLGDKEGFIIGRDLGYEVE
jgi:translation initiation factor 1 (eIF-1/SUI1)